jgi:hypothetical protein
VKVRLATALLTTLAGVTYLLAGSAAANHIPTAAVSCIAVSATWTDFPPTDQTISFAVAQPGSPGAHLEYHTKGARSGTTGNLAIAMTGNGTITATITAKVVEAGPRVVTATADCRPPVPTTTTTTTLPPTTTTFPPTPPPPPVDVVVTQPVFTG